MTENVHHLQPFAPVTASAMWRRFPKLRHTAAEGVWEAQCPVDREHGLFEVKEAEDGWRIGLCGDGCLPREIWEAAKPAGGDVDTKENVFVRNHRQLTAEELEADPPPFQFILRPYIPAKCVSVLTGPGGSNKTTLLLWLAVCRALGRAMFRDMVPEEGETVIVTCEDRVADYQRKLAAFRLHLGTEWNSKAIAERIHFFDLSGELVRFVEAQRGEQFKPTALVDEFVVALKSKAPHANYVTVETISRVTGGVENNPAMAALVGAGEQICRAADLTLTYVGHVSQADARSGRIDAYSSRGGSALGDSGRSSIGMAPLNEDKKEVYARGLEITGDDLERTIVLAHTKTNGVAAAKPLLLYRNSTRWGPVLVEPSFPSADAESKGKKVPGRKANRTYQQLCKAIVDYVAAKQPVSGNEVWHDLGGNKGHFGNAVMDLIKANKIGRDAEGRLVVLNSGSESKPIQNQLTKEPPVPNPSLPLTYGKGKEKEGIQNRGGSELQSEPSLEPVVKKTEGEVF